MDSIYSSPLTKATLTGVFVGFVATLLCMTYNVFFRGSTGFSPSYIINVSSMIFFINTLFLLLGVVYYGFLRVKKGEALYIALFVLLTAVLAFLADHVHRSDIPLVNTEFHQLLVPIVLILGISAAFGIPYLFHNRKFEENVL